MCCQTQSSPLLDSLGLEEPWSLLVLPHVLILSAVSGSLWARAPLCGCLHLSQHHRSCSNSSARQVQPQLTFTATAGVGSWGSWGLGWGLGRSGVKESWVTQPLCRRVNFDQRKTRYRERDYSELQGFHKDFLKIQQQVFLLVEFWPAR